METFKTICISAPFGTIDYLTKKTQNIILSKIQNV